jgi:hypothetical protein
VMTNGAWLKMQKFIASLGYSRVRKRTVLTGYPVVDSTDPASECRLSWSYFYDGVSYWIPPNVQVLPQDLIAPLKIGERQSTGYQPTLTTSGRTFSKMQLAPDGNIDWRKKPWNGWFDWRNDEIIMPGSTSIMDFEIFYAAALPAFNTVGEVSWYEQPVPIVQADSALANFICYEFSKPRGDMDAAGFLTDAQQDCRDLYNVSDVPLKQRNNISRRSFAGNRTGTGYGYGGL